MMTVRRFPFGSEPALPPSPPAERTMPVPPPDPQATAPLSDFVSPRSPLPFRTPEPPTERVPLTPLPPVTERLAPLVPPPPPRDPARQRVSMRTVAWALLLALDLIVLGYLAATWRP